MTTVYRGFKKDLEFKNTELNTFDSDGYIVNLQKFSFESVNSLK